MRGHTSNRILKATLRGVSRTARAEAKKRADYPAEVDYFLGKADACAELWCLLALEGDIHVQDRNEEPDRTA